MDDSLSLEIVFTKLALTEDNHLEQVLQKLLPSLLVRIGSADDSARKKVMDIMNHVNLRVKEHKNIKLPLRELVVLYKSSFPSGSPLVLNFSMVYLEMAYGRASQEQRLEVIPEFLDGISKKPTKHRYTLMRCVAMGIELYGSVRGIKSEEVEGKFSFISNDEDSNTWLTFSLYTLLFMPPMKGPDGSLLPVPGLSPSQAAWVTGATPLSGQALSNRKLALLNFNVALGFSTEQLYPHFLVAAADSNDKVSARGEDLLKRRAGSMNLDNSSLIRSLLSLYLGSNSRLGKPAAAQGPSNGDVSTVVSPASLPLKLRLLSSFTRSTVAANCFPATLQVVMDSVYGPTSNTRLKQCGMEFAVWMFKHASEAQLKSFAPVMMSGLLRLLSANKAADGDKSVQQLRAFTYQAIGQLAARMPHLVSSASAVAALLFKALRTEPAAWQSVLLAAGQDLRQAYSNSPPAVKAQLAKLLLDNIKSTVPTARLCSVQWASAPGFLPSEDPTARLVCLIACSDEKLEIREMAERSLSPSTPTVSAPVTAFPSLQAMLSCLLEHCPALATPARVGELSLLLPLPSFLAAIKLLSNCWKGGYKQQQLPAEALEQPVLESFLRLLEHGMAIDGSWALHADAAQGMLELACSYRQSQAVSVYCSSSGRLDWLLHLLPHADSSVRDSLACLLGVSVSSAQTAMDPALLTSLLSRLCVRVKSSRETKSGARQEDILGDMAALGYVLAQCRTQESLVPGDLLQSCTASLVSVLVNEKSTSEQLAVGAAQALGHVGLRGPLPLPEGTISMETVTTSLKSMLQSTETKTVKSVALAAGHLCFGNPSLSPLLLGDFLALSKSESEDVVLAAGESLALIWGPSPPVSADTFLLSPLRSLSLSTDLFGAAAGSKSHPTEGEANSMDELSDAEVGLTEVQQSIRERLLNADSSKCLLGSSRKEERRAAAMWLMALLAFSGRTRGLQNLLSEFQEALAGLLSEADSVTQEMASRGLTRVYQLAEDPKLKDSLLQAMLGTLSGTSASRKRQGKVMDSPVLVETAPASSSASSSRQAAAGTGAGTGNGQLSTYRELCSMASDMGQPDLVYKFMELANYQSSLRSSSGAAFGVSLLLSEQSGLAESLEPLLPSLVPRLLRLQHDPSQQMQEAASSIWKAIVVSSKDTINKLWTHIIEDLLKESGSRLWRSRESAALAMTEILPSRTFDQVIGYLSRAWESSFRLCDDIKESVRDSGDRLLRSLSSLTVRLCDASKSSSQQCCAAVVPVLLAKGLPSSVQAVRSTAISTLLKIVKSSGSGARPSLPEIVPAMLEALSSLEDQTLNYAQFHAEGLGVSAAQLEGARISKSRESPMWSTLDWALQNIDSASLQALVPRLVDTVRTGVGLNTRVGTARFISLMVQKIGSQEMEPHSASLLKVLVPSVQSERSSACRRALATACADVAKCAGDARLSALLSQCASLLQSPESAALHMGCALILRELCRGQQGSSLLQQNRAGIAQRVVPVAFLARQSGDQAVAAVFEEVWEEVCVGPPSATLQVYLPEVLPLLLEAVKSSSWPTKKQGAKSCVQLAEILQADLPKDSAGEIMALLLSELPGRLWEGKECLLEAIGALCQHCTGAFPLSSNQGVPAQVCQEVIVQAVLEALDRKKTAFREASLKCLAQVLTAFSSLDSLPLVIAPLAAILNASSAEKTEESQGQSLFVPALDCLSASMAAAQAASLVSHGSSVVQAVQQCMSTAGQWTVRLSAIALCRSFQEAVLRTAAHEMEPARNFLPSSVAALLAPLQDLKYSQVRTAALDCLQALLKLPAGRQAVLDDSAVLASLQCQLDELASGDKHSGIKIQASTIRAYLTSP